MVRISRCLNLASLLQAVYPMMRLRAYGLYRRPVTKSRIAVFLLCTVPCTVPSKTATAKRATFHISRVVFFGNAAWPCARSFYTRARGITSRQQASGNCKPHLWILTRWNLPNVWEQGELFYERKLAIPPWHKCCLCCVYLLCIPFV